MKLLSLLTLLVAFPTWAISSPYDAHVARLKRADVLGQSIAYVDEGQGPAVVLMHGIPTSSWMYRNVIPLLVAAGRRVIAPDLLGFGESGRPADRSLLLVPNQAQLMLTLLKDELKLERWTHVVHDFAGPITWEMAEDPRFTPSGLVVLDTLAFNEGWNPGMNFLMRTVMRAGTGVPGVRQVFFHQAFRDMVSTPGVADADMLEGYCRPMIEGGAASYRTLLFSTNQLAGELPRYQGTLRSLGVPAAIVWGRNDAFLSVETQMPPIRDALGVPQERVTILNDAKHLVADEQPEAVAAAVLGLP